MNVSYKIICSTPNNACQEHPVLSFLLFILNKSGTKSSTIHTRKPFALF